MLFYSIEESIGAVVLNKNFKLIYWGILSAFFLLGQAKFR